MNSSSGLGALVALVAAGTLAALVLWISWRKPTFVFLVALAALAIRPQLLWGGQAIGYEWGLHQTLLLFALLINAARHGVRTTVPWPIAALVVTFVLGLAFGDLHPKLTLPFMLMGLAILALPFAFTQVVFAPGSRRICALVTMLIPPASIAIGAMLQLAGTHEAFDPEAWTGNRLRLEGATGNASVFGMLAFTGFVVALHEWTRPARPYAAPLAVINLILVILSGTRMAIFASAAFLGTYAWLSGVLRRQLRQRRIQAGAAAALIALTLLAYGPTLVERMFADDSEALSLSGRGDLWTFYWQEFLFSPWFGRGFGTGFVAAAAWLPSYLPLPHNEYLHLLVIGGVVGFALVGGGIGLWYGQLLRVASPNDRELLFAVVPALAVYALTDNILIYSSALALYAYLGVILTRPSSLRLTAPEAEPWRAERARAHSS